MRQGGDENVAYASTRCTRTADTSATSAPRTLRHQPDVTLKPTDDTKIKLSYEFYHDFRLPIAAIPRGLPGGATRFNPRRVRTERRSLDVLRQPNLQQCQVEVQTAMAVIEHDFGNGLTVKNGTIYADYNAATVNLSGGTGAPAAAVAAR